MEEIQLSKLELARIIHQYTDTELNELEREDPEAYHVVAQIGLFFAINPLLANYTVDIDELVLHPRPRGAPPLAEVRITRRRRTYRLQTASDGRLPPLPFGRRRDRRRRR